MPDPQHCSTVPTQSKKAFCTSTIDEEFSTELCSDSFLYTEENDGGLDLARFSIACILSRNSIANLSFFCLFSSTS
jgi:hypothetical protein